MAQLRQPLARNTQEETRRFFAVFVGVSRTPGWCQSGTRPDYSWLTPAILRQDCFNGWADEAKPVDCGRSERKRNDGKHEQRKISRRDEGSTTTARKENNPKWRKGNQYGYDGHILRSWVDILLLTFIQLANDRKLWRYVQWRKIQESYHVFRTSTP